MLSILAVILAYTLAVDACGQSSYAGSRVIGGETAKPNSWPWQVAIYYNRGFHCGGSLISPTWLVTAAHCVHRTNSRAFDLVLGEHNRNVREGSEQYYKASYVIAHPRYNPRTLDNDIALIRLNAPAKLNSKVALVCLPRAGEMVPPGTKCYITGWGKMRHPGNAAIYLQQSPLPVVSRSTCFKNTQNMGIPITSNMLCAGYGSSSPRSGCHGDSGGPFVCNQGGRWVLHGDVSWGSGRCSTRDGYTVFGRVANYIDWIGSYVRN